MSIFEKQPKNSGGINYIMRFEISLAKPFYQKLQKRLGISDEGIKKLEKEMPNLIYKMEEYVNEFIRIKMWFHTEDKSSYVEDDNPDFYHYKGYVFWELDVEDEHIGLTYNKGEFQLYLLGSKSGVSTEDYDEFKPLDENILLRLKPYDFKVLEKYHKLHNKMYQDAATAWYYMPEQNHRTYTNLNEDGKNDGIYWTLDWLDFTGKYLPKLKYNESGDYTVDI
jgi:hypothetical protein